MWGRRQDSFGRASHAHRSTLGSLSGSGNASQLLEYHQVPPEAGRSKKVWNWGASTVEEEDRGANDDGQAEVETDDDSSKTDCKRPTWM